MGAAGKSSEAVGLLSDLLARPPAQRWAIVDRLDDRDVTALLEVSKLELGTPYALWQGDPVKFVQDVLDEAIWSGQKQLLRSIVDNAETAVPSTFSSGKTRSVALATIYWAQVYTPGTAVVVTIAPRWRQVTRQVWPEIRRMANRAGLPGAVDQAQWRILDQTGLQHIPAYGIAAAPTSEDAVQGIHSPHLLLVVDEAGGIAPSIGRNLAGLLTGGHAHMIAIGNPPTDDESSWFEQLCLAERVNTIKLSAFATPNFTGEETPWCKSCPEAMDRHRLSHHLVKHADVDAMIEDHGEDSRYVVAKVHAEFPHGAPNTLIPAHWVSAAVHADEPDPAGMVALDQLSIPGETRQWLVQLGAWVRLGVDVASDGGDELVVARMVGNLGTIEHKSAGAGNSNAVDVAGQVLEQILAAQLLAQRLGSRHPVRVKVDVIGVGWAVASQLERWGEEGRHSAQIIRVDVREVPRRSSDAATLRPARKRDEMWLAIRSLLQPTAPGEDPRVRLRVDQHTTAQLSAPRYATDSTGHTVVESKDSMRRRKVRSPDRAEAMALAVYEPATYRAKLLN